MKKIILTIMFCGVTIIAKSQNYTASVEKTTYGIQVGLLGIWMHNETKLNDRIVLRSELGMNTIFISGVFIESGYLMAPEITIEPKWYYILKKGRSEQQNVSGNSGNYISLRTSYNSDIFVITNTSNHKVRSNISIIPAWGIRRSIGKHITFETGIGLKFIHFLEKNPVNTNIELDLYLHLRIGYRF